MVTQGSDSMRLWIDLSRTQRVLEHYLAHRGIFHLAQSRSYMGSFLREMEILPLSSVLQKPHLLRKQQCCFALTELQALLHRQTGRLDASPNQIQQYRANRASQGLR